MKIVIEDRGTSVVINTSGYKDVDIQEMNEGIDLSDDLHGKRVLGGIAIGPYAFIDGVEGYMVVAPHSQRCDTEHVQWSIVSDNVDGLAKSVDPDWIDPYTGIDNTYQLAVTKSQGRIFPAATICYTLSFEGCDDYFLPNKNELEYIYNNISAIDAVDETGSLGTDHRYWSSSEYYANSAWSIRFSSGSILGDSKGSNRALVPIRRILLPKKIYMK